MAFLAKYSGTCSICKHKIVANKDMIERSSKGYAHVNCEETTLGSTERDTEIFSHSYAPIVAWKSPWNKVIVSYEGHKGSELNLKHIKNRLVHYMLKSLFPQKTTRYQWRHVFSFKEGDREFHRFEHRQTNASLVVDETGYPWEYHSESFLTGGQYRPIANYTQALKIKDFHHGKD